MMRISMLVALLVTGLISTVAHTQEGDAATLATAASAQPAAALFNNEDLLFLHHMIIHHAQAVVMSPMVATRTDREEFIRFAGYVQRAQAAEIGLMQSLLDLAAERGLDVPQHVMLGDPPMSGMLSNAQMAALAAASGAEFERLWLEGMIYHHQGAIDMARAQQRQQLDTGRRPYVLSVLVEDILVEQRAEITRMRAWLNEWGLASTGAAHNSAAEPGRSHALDSVNDREPMIDSLAASPVDQEAFENG